MTTSTAYLRAFGAYRLALLANASFSGHSAFDLLAVTARACLYVRLSPRHWFIAAQTRRSIEVDVLV